MLNNFSRDNYVGRVICFKSCLTLALELIVYWSHSCLKKSPTLCGILRITSG